MATRCNIIVEDDRNRIQIYRNSDGYPDTEHGVLADLQSVFPYAWPLPRFEADEFSAAIVAAWKSSIQKVGDTGYFVQGGNILIDGNPRGNELLHGDIEWLYTITRSKKEGCIHVIVEQMYGDRVITDYDICPEEPEEPTSDDLSGLEPELGGKE